MSSDPHQCLAEFERRLSEANIAKAVRYMTQCVEGTQIAQAYVNLATLYYAGKPFSNSVLLHELREAEEFEKLGFDFASDRLLQMSDGERSDLYDLKQRSCWRNREPHILAMTEQYEYLSAVAIVRGHFASSGTLLHYSMCSTMGDIILVRNAVPAMQIVEHEVEAAKKFMLELIPDEVDWAGHVVGWADWSDKPPTVLFQECEDEIRSILESHSDWNWRARRTQ